MPGGADAATVRIQEIARLARVSVGTVDRALHGRKEISEKTRKEILRIAESVGYEPNWAARALRKGRGNLRIGVCTPREIRFFYDQIRDGILNEARRFRHLGVDVLYQPLPEFGVGEAAAFRKLIKRGAQAIIFAPRRPARLAPLIDAAEKEQDVRVVCIATDVSSSCRSTVVSMPPGINGMLAAELMSKILTAPARVAVVTGMLETEHLASNTNGFVDVFTKECPGSEVVAVIEDHQHEAESFQKCTNLLQRFPDLAGIYVNTVNSLPVCRLLKALGLVGKVKLITTDVFLELVPNFQDGTIAASIYQQPYRQGQAAVRLLVEHFFHGQPLPHSYYLEPSIAMRHNLQFFRELRATAAPKMGTDEIAPALAAVSRTKVSLAFIDRSSKKC